MRRSTFALLALAVLCLSSVASAGTTALGSGQTLSSNAVQCTPAPGTFCGWVTVRSYYNGSHDGDPYYSQAVSDSIACNGTYIIPKDLYGNFSPVTVPKCPSGYTFTWLSKARTDNGADAWSSKITDAPMAGFGTCIKN